MKKTPVLSTDRLVLRGIEERDAKEIVRLRSNPDVFKYFLSPHKLTIEEHLEWYRTNYIREDNRLEWIALDYSLTVVGIFGARRMGYSEDSVEISYILSPNYYGRGYAREAVSRIAEFCKGEWSIRFLVAKIHKDNENSIRFIEKIKFKQVSEDGSFVVYKGEI